MKKFSAIISVVVFLFTAQAHLWIHGPCGVNGSKQDCGVLHIAPAPHQNGEQCEQTSPEICPETLFQILHAQTGLTIPVQAGFLQVSTRAAETGFARSQVISPHLNALSSVILLI